MVCVENQESSEFSSIKSQVGFRGYEHEINVWANGAVEGGVFGSVGVFNEFENVIETLYQ